MTATRERRRMRYDGPRREPTSHFIIETISRASIHACSYDWQDLVDAAKAWSRLLTDMRSQAYLSLKHARQSGPWGITPWIIRLTETAKTIYTDNNQAVLETALAHYVMDDMEPPIKVARKDNTIANAKRSRWQTLRLFQARRLLLHALPRDLVGDDDSLTQCHRCIVRLENAALANVIRLYALEPGPEGTELLRYELLGSPHLPVYVGEFDKEFSMRHVRSNEEDATWREEVDKKLQALANQYGHNTNQYGHKGRNDRRK